MNKVMVNNAFKEGTSSLFVLTSPLQVLCAVEAIDKFKIKEYRILLALPEKEKRNDQVFNLCDKFGLCYSLVSAGIGKFDWLKAIVTEPKLYERAFIGDIRQLSQWYYAIRNLKNNSAIVCLDDGNDTIFLLNGEQPDSYSYKGKILILFLKCLMAIRNISFGYDLFTLYGDIKNVSYACVLNNFSRIVRESSLKKKREGIYFLGTNFSRFCSDDNFPFNNVMNGLKTILSDIKRNHPNERILYIPHGRDTTTNPMTICKELDIELLRPSTTIEIMMLEDNIIPHTVYGFTSTALYNIRILFPSVDVYNVTFRINHSNQFIKQVRVVSDYYSNHGIKEIVL